jgi:cyanophycinase
MFATAVRLFVCVLAFGSFCTGLSAQENLLGLPAPRDPAKPGAVVLHGGGSITDDVFDRFVELAGGKDARIVLVPSAGYRPLDYDTEEELLADLDSRFRSWVMLPKRGRAKSFQFLYTDEPADAEDAAFVKPLETATGVWFSGGAQSRLNYRFVGEWPEPSRFQRALRQVLVRGGAVGGTSAGMAAMPEIMTMREARAYDTSPAICQAAHGFGLFSRAIVEQHFDGRGGRLERFTSLLRDNDALDALAGRRGAGTHMMGLAVEERTALVAHGPRFEVLGTGSVHVFIKTQAGRSLTWHILEPGDSAQLKRDAINLAELKREEVWLAK